MADKVVQRLSQSKSNSSFEGSKGDVIQTKSIIQKKCSTCEEEEKLQKKEDDISENEIEIQRKPIFESNAEQPDADIQSKALTTPALQAKCSSCDEEEKLQKKEEEELHDSELSLQRKANDLPSENSSDLESSLNLSKGGGSSLPSDMQSSMGSEFGADFSNIKVHTGSEAVQMSQDIGAQAFTHGSDIYFNQGKYDTNSGSGKHLLAHELTHTVQQGATSLVQKKGKYHGEEPLVKSVTERDLQKKPMSPINPINQKTASNVINLKRKINRNQKRDEKKVKKKLKKAIKLLNSVQLSLKSETQKTLLKEILDIVTELIPDKLGLFDENDQIERLGRPSYLPYPSIKNGKPSNPGMQVRMSLSHYKGTTSLGRHRGNKYLSHIKLYIPNIKRDSPVEIASLIAHEGVHMMSYIRQKRYPYTPTGKLIKSPSDQILGVKSFSGFKQKFKLHFEKILKFLNNQTHRDLDRLTSKDLHQAEKNTIEETIAFVFGRIIDEAIQSQISQKGKSVGTFPEDTDGFVDRYMTNWIKNLDDLKALKSKSGAMIMKRMKNDVFNLQKAVEKQMILNPDKAVQPKLKEGVDNEIFRKKKKGISSDRSNERQEKLIIKNNIEQAETVMQKSKTGSLSRGTTDLQSRLDSSKGRGNSMPSDIQSSMDSAFGVDFSKVRVHTGSNSVQMNKELGAQAFTHGNDIYFNQDKYDTNSNSGKHLLAHELTHTVQQGASKPNIQKSEEEDRAAELAKEIYDALDWINDIPRLFRAMGGRDESMRIAIRRAFMTENQGIPLQNYLQDQLDSDNLVRAYALLSDTNYHGPHVSLGLGLIPLETRDEEVFRILEGRKLNGRNALEEKYNDVFGTDGWNYLSIIGEGSLRRDLKNDLSFDDEEKALMLLHRDLHESDRLYLDSRALISGTRTDNVVNLLQSEWRKGPDNFHHFVQKWDTNIKDNDGNWRDSALNETLREAMYEELSGEEKEQAKAVLDAHDRYKKQGLLQSDLGIVPPTDEQKYIMEEIRLEEAQAALDAATTGGHTGLGTDEEQVFSAIQEINKIWTERIARVTNPLNMELKVEYEGLWEEKRRMLTQFLPNEMDEGTPDYIKTRLLLAGSPTLADEIYLAKLDYDYDKINSLVRKAWAQGKVFEASRQASDARLDSVIGDIVRPAYDMDLIIGANHGSPARELYSLTNRDYSQPRRGANLIDEYLARGTSNSDLDKALNFLKQSEVSSGLRTNTIDSYVRTYIRDQEGESTIQKFLNYIGNRYNRSGPVWDFHDLLAPAESVDELLRRAEGRRNAENTGVFNLALNDAVQDYDNLTGEDTLASVEESLQRLRFYSVESNLTAEELQGLIVMAGETNDPNNPNASLIALSQLEYRDFNSRLQSLRSIKQTIADAIATAVELVVEAAITIATGGAGGAALIGSISAAVAGMLVREGLLGDNYELVSKQNIQQLVVTIASHGFGQMGNNAFNEVLDPRTIERLGGLGSFLEGASEGVSSQIGQQLATAAFTDRMPTVEQLAAGAANIVVSGISSGTSNTVSNNIRNNASGMERLRNTLASSLADSMIGGLGQEGVAIVASSDGNLTGLDVGLRLGRTAASSFGEGLVSGLGEAGGQLNAERHRQRQESTVPETDFDQMLTDQLGEVTSEVPGDNSDVPTNIPAVNQEARVQVQQLAERVGMMSVELQRLLVADASLRSRLTENPDAIHEGNVEAWNEIAQLAPMNPLTYPVLLDNPDLRRALIENPSAARALRYCASPCFTANASAQNILDLQSLIQQARDAGQEFDMSALNEFLHQHQEAYNLNDALQRLRDDFMGTIEQGSQTSYDSISEPDGWDPPSSYQRARNQLEEAGVPIDLMQRLIDKGYYMADSTDFFQNINLMMRRDSTFYGPILYGLASNDKYSVATMLAGRLAIGGGYVARVQNLITAFNLNQLAIAFDALKESRPELGDGHLFNWLERTAALHDAGEGHRDLTWFDLPIEENHPGEGFQDIERGRGEALISQGVKGNIGEYLLTLEYLRAEMPHLSNPELERIADSMFQHSFGADRRRPRDVETALHDFADGTISFNELLDNLPEQGAVQVTFPMHVGRFTSRIVDHLFRRGDTAVFREQKNVANLSAREGSHIAFEIAKDIKLLLTHPNSIVEWRIINTDRPDPETNPNPPRNLDEIVDQSFWDYVREQTIAEGVGDRFIIIGDDRTIRANEIP